MLYSSAMDEEEIIIDAVDFSIRYPTHTIAFQTALFYSTADLPKIRMKKGHAKYKASMHHSVGLFYICKATGAA